MIANHGMATVPTGSRAALHARPKVGYKRQPTAQTKCGMATVPTGGKIVVEFFRYCVIIILVGVFRMRGVVKNGR